MRLWLRGNTPVTVEAPAPAGPVPWPGCASSTARGRWYWRLCLPPRYLQAGCLFGAASVRVGLVHIEPGEAAPPTLPDVGERSGQPEVFGACLHLSGLARRSRVPTRAVRRRGPAKQRHGLQAHEKVRLTLPCARAAPAHLTGETLHDAVRLPFPGGPRGAAASTAQAYQQSSRPAGWHSSETSDRLRAENPLLAVLIQPVRKSYGWVPTNMAHAMALHDVAQHEGRCSNGTQLTGGSTPMSIECMLRA